MAPRRTLTVTEAANVLGIGRTAAYEAVRRREIPSIRIGRSVRVPIAAIDKMLGGGPSERLVPDGQGGFRTAD